METVEAGFALRLLFRPGPEIVSDCSVVAPPAVALVRRC
jgi:hypothetical protein